MRCTTHSRLYCVATKCVDERKRKESKPSHSSAHYDDTVATWTHTLGSDSGGGYSSSSDSSSGGGCD